jgi:hypothetical protein
MPATEQRIQEIRETISKVVQRPEHVERITDFILRLEDEQPLHLQNGADSDSSAGEPQRGPNWGIMAHLKPKPEGTIEERLAKFEKSIQEGAIYGVQTNDEMFDRDLLYERPF